MLPRKRRLTQITLTTLLGIVVGLGPILARPLSAADKYKPDDEIEVFFLNKWFPAKLVDQNRRGEVMAEFEFANTTKRQTFKANEVRFAYEADSIAPARFWSDTSGSFKVRAALLSLTKDTVLLRKEDKSEIRVPIAKLSQGDQDFLKKLKKDLGPGAIAAAAPPPAEEFDISSPASVWSMWGTTGPQRAAIEPDPAPSYLKLQQGGVGFPNQDFFDRLGTVLALGGNDSWVLAAVENGKPSAPRPTRLVWASLAKQKIMGQQLLPAGEVVLDYHQPSKQVLTYGTMKGEGRRDETAVLSLWKAAPTDEEATPIARWKLDGDKSASAEKWARIIDANTVLQRWDRNELVAWDISEKKMRFKLPQESFFAPDPVLSGTRKYLLLPEDKNVRILEAATGKLLCTLPAPEGSSALAVTEDGRQLAVLNRSTIVVWDLTSETAEPTTYQAQAIATPFRSTIDWVGPDRILADIQGGFGKVLFSLKHGVALWNYQFDMSAVPEQRGRRVRQIIDGHLAYAATVRQGGDSGLAVGAVKLPGPKVEETVAALDPDSLLVVKRGTAMRVEVNAGEYNAAVSDSLRRILDTNGWVYDANAPIAMIADMKRGDTQQVTYQSFGVGGGQQTVSVTPFISNLRIEVNKQVAWQSGTSTGAPHSMRLQAGQTAQSEIDKWQKPDPDFFGRVTVPEKLLDPTKRNGLGTTDVTTRGLVPK